MKIVIASDHAGFQLKEAIKTALAQLSVEYEDLGPADTDSVDYPDYARKVALAIHDDVRGILCCGTGIGMSIAANKFPGIRAALCNDEYTAKMSRAHNDSNILILGGRVLKHYEDVPGIVKAWLESGFEGGRHQRRLDKISQFEHQDV